MKVDQGGDFFYFDPKHLWLREVGTERGKSQYLLQLKCDAIFDIHETMCYKPQKQLEIRIDTFLHIGKIKNYK